MKENLLIVGIVIFLLGLLSAPFFPANSEVPTWLMIGGVAVLGFYMIANWRKLAKRSTFFGLNAIVMSVVVIVILSVVYLIADQRDKSWDLTATGKYTLDPQTAKILEGLDSPVKILLFATPEMKQSSEFLIAKDLVDQYTRYSNKVVLEVLDPSKDYETAVQYAADLDPRAPTLIAELEIAQASGEGDSTVRKFKEKAADITQEGISNAIMKVTHREAVKAYFLTGHYERELDGEDPTGLALIKSYLEDENIDPATLRLSSTAEIPEDADIIALVGPQQDLTEVELEALDNFVLGGGGLFVALDPGELPQTTLKLREMGFEVGSDEVITMEVGADSIDALLRGVMTARPSKTVPLAEFDETHEITQQLGNASVKLTQARSIGKIPVPPTGITLTELAKSEGGKVGQTNLPSSWAEKNPEQLRQGATISLEEIFDPTKDSPGPVTLLMSAEVNLDQHSEGRPNPEHPDRRGKIVVAGDSDFLTNGGMRVQSGFSSGISRGHLDLTLNVFNWLAGQVDLITIRQEEVDNTSITLTKEQEDLLENVFVWVVPAVIALLGVAVVSYRRWMYV
jgi:ABC-type uncharacterized transport system involved in gliding motility auxiliary subunit